MSRQTEGIRVLNKMYRFYLPINSKCYFLKRKIFSQSALQGVRFTEIRSIINLTVPTENTVLKIVSDKLSG